MIFDVLFLVFTPGTALRHELRNARAIVPQLCAPFFLLIGVLGVGGWEWELDGVEGWARCASDPMRLRPQLPFTPHKSSKVVLRIPMSFLPRRPPSCEALAHRWSSVPQLFGVFQAIQRQGYGHTPRRAALHRRVFNLACGPLGGLATLAADALGYPYGVSWLSRSCHDCGSPSCSFLHRRSYPF